jgi:hypothetical protein
MFAKFEHPNKGLIITGALGGNFIGALLTQAPGLMHPHRYGGYGSY